MQRRDDRGRFLPNDRLEVICRRMDMAGQRLDRAINALEAGEPHAGGKLRRRGDALRRR